MATVRKQIKEASDQLRELMEDHLSGIAENLVNQVMASARQLIPSRKLEAIKDLSPVGIQAYKSELLDALAMMANDAIEGARKEVPKAKNVKLSDADPVQLGELERLPLKLQKRIKTRLDLLVGKQIGDLQKTIEFAYAEAENETDSDEVVENDIRDSALGWLDGPAMETGAALNASSVINDARNAFFFDDQVLEELDAFEFVNGDPVTPVCQDLAGTIFSKDDPEADRYFPPLHWNCKSSIQPILKGNLGKREISSLKPSKASLDQYVKFAEKCTCSDE